jgi:hypothetical protein
VSSGELLQDGANGTEDKMAVVQNA